MDIIGEVIYNFISSGLSPLRLLSKKIILGGGVGRNFKYVVTLSPENKDEIISLFPVSLNLKSGREEMNVTVKIKKVEEIKKGRIISPYYKVHLIGKIKWRKKK